MEIAPGVHHLKFVLRPENKGSLNLLVGNETGLIDTGTPPQPDATLQPYCSQIGVDPKSISVIANTHWHGDHMGGNAQLKALSGASVMAHLLDVEFIENPVASVEAFVARYGKYHPMYGRSREEMSQGQPQGTKVDRVLEEGEEVDIGDRTFQVLHTPGHTPGSISFYERSTGTVFAGDALQGEGQAGGLAYYIDLEPYLSTLDKFDRLDMNTLVVAHDYLPLRESVLKGRQIVQFLNACRDTVIRYDNQVLETLGQEQKPLTVGEVTRGVLEKNGWGDVAIPGPPGPAVSSVACVLTHLERLASNGQVRRLPPGGAGHPDEESWAKT